MKNGRIIRGFERQEEDFIHSVVGNCDPFMISEQMSDMIKVVFKEDEYGKYIQETLDRIILHSSKAAKRLLFHNIKGCGRLYYYFKHLLPLSPTLYLPPLGSGLDHVTCFG